MKVGVALPHYDFSYPDGRPADLDATVAFARRAEELGYDSVWMSDHFFLDLSRYGGPKGRSKSLEAITTLSAIAVETERVRLGTLVLCEAFRHPPVLAKMASTLDIVSDGRLELGIGAGWYEDEYRAFGFRFPPTAERIERLRETADILGGMLSSGRFTYEGRYYRVEDAPNDPPPAQRPRPPIWIGGKGGPKVMRIVAEAADGWNTVWRWTPEAYAERSRQLDRACDRAGRDPATARRSLGLYTVVGSDERDFADRWERTRRTAPIDASELRREDFERDALAGSADDCVARIKEFEALGVEHVVCSFGLIPFMVSDEEQVELFARDVLPRVR
ncbi:MAG: TIGR03560 family F420-dependent LLM class oxidoreductase [Actinobacteria bacterium]|nr:MAG: TIGR03560 family F420-dependent LLM class oxidoreductase [Actinomycetota bacterium]